MMMMMMISGKFLEKPTGNKLVHMEEFAWRCVLSSEGKSTERYEAVGKEFVQRSEEQGTAGPRHFKPTAM